MVELVFLFFLSSSCFIIKFIESYEDELHITGYKNVKSSRKLTLIDKMPCTICRKVCFGNLETIYKTDLKEKIKEME